MTASGKQVEDGAWHAVLAAHGFAPGPAGHDEDAVRAAIAARGWVVVLHEAARAGTYRRVRRWQAALRRGRPGNEPLMAMARGRSEAEALAKALAHVLWREARG